jgi:predicted nucleotidyltransferase
MIKVLGIIAEYNPFHNGHLYHLQQSIKQLNPDYVIAVMSGHFTQRGEATIVDKWARTAMALQSGIDLVLELPVVYACQTAELFAFGGIQLLNHTGIVTHLAFGSEVAEIKVLDTIASILAIEPDEYKNQLKSQLRNGLSFPQARLRALEEYIKSNKSLFPYPSECLHEIITSSNAILGIEYLKAIKRTNSSIKPVPIRRIGSLYNDTEIKGKFSSATAIRNHLLATKSMQDLSEALPSYSLEILEENIRKGRGPVTNQSLEQIIMGTIRRSSLEEIRCWMDVEEGLENRIKEFGHSCSTLDEFLTQAKTKRYVYTRLQRILIHGLLGITTKQMKEYNKLGGPCYLRILGFRKKSLSLLTHLKENAHVPIISKPADYFRPGISLLNGMFELDVLATDMYCLGFPGQYHRKGGQDFTHPIVIL